MENLLSNEEEATHDKSVNFYYTNLINGLVLFSLTADELNKLTAPTFDPLSELETELDYAYLPVCFETLFRNKRIAVSLKEELLAFKQAVDNIPAAVWDWEFIDEEMQWVDVRQRASVLLDKLGIENRQYNDDYTTIYDTAGNIIKKGKKVD